jgi:dihydroflavonol-4-reductase
MQQLAFLTGSTGLIGGHLLVYLYKCNYKVRALIRPTSSFAQLKLICDFYGLSFGELYNSIEWINGNTLDFVGLKESISGVDEVFHCAALVSFNRKKSKDLLVTNVRGTANIVDAALECGVKRLCFISSIGSLGSENNNAHIDENSFRDPNKEGSVYTESKYLSELEVWRGSAEGLDVVILNPGVVLGPGIPDRGSMLLFNVARKGMPFYTDATTGYVDVRDVCRAAIGLMSENIFGKRFVLVSENLSNRQLFTLIANEFGKKGPSIRAGKIILNTAALVSDLIGKLTGSIPQLTKETVKTAQNPQRYSSKNVIETLNFEFLPIQTTVKETAEFIKKNNL